MVGLLVVEKVLNLVEMKVVCLAEMKVGESVGQMAEMMASQMVVWLVD